MQSSADSERCACKPELRSLDTEGTPEKLLCCNVAVACPAIYSHRNGGERPKKGIFQ